MVVDSESLFDYSTIACRLAGYCCARKVELLTLFALTLHLLLPLLLYHRMTQLLNIVFIAIE